MENADRLHVLIVEDDEDICDNLQDILELDEHRITVAYTGREALTADDLDSVNVILLDWQLPDVTALQLLPTLGETIPAAEIIIVTGHGDLESAITSLRQGAVDYLLKPINPDSLRTSLQRIGRRQRLEREKLRSDRAFRQLVEAAPSAIVIVRPEGSIVYFSSFSEQLTGYVAAEVLGKNFVEFFLPKDVREDFVGKLRQTLVDEGKRGFQGPLLDRDRRLRQMVWNSQFLEDFDGSPAVLAIGQDITEYRKAMDRVVQTERLAAIGEAMTGLVHESRNALARCQANLRRLARRLQGQPELLELIAATQCAQEDIGRQFEEVREYAAPLKLSRQPCVILELVEEAWEQLEAERESRIAELRVNAVHPLLACDVDHFLMVNVCRNLLQNSLTTDTGEVLIEVDFALTTIENCEAVKLTIRDHGPGLAPESFEKALDAFYTTKTRGTGLGLAIVKRIVEAHGGSISIANVPPGEGTGAIVTLFLPQKANESSDSWIVR